MTALVSTQKILFAGVLFPVVFSLILIYSQMDVHIEYSFQLPDKIQVGSEFDVIVDISIKGGYGIVNVMMPVYDEMEIIEGTNVHMIYKGFGERTLSFKYHGKAMRRGIFKWTLLKIDFNPVLAQSKYRQISKVPDKPITVDPEFHILKKSQFQIMSKRKKPRNALTRLGPPTTDFETIREYAPGDPFKSINWKASARVNSRSGLMVNQYEREGMKTYIFYLDTSMMMRRGTEYENPLEYAISLILSGSNYLISRGYNVGYWPISSRMVNRQDFIVPSSGMDTFNQIKRRLLLVESSRIFTSTYPVDKTLARLVMETRARVAIITSVDQRNESLIKELRGKLIALGGSVTVVNIRPEGIVAKNVDARMAPLFSPSMVARGKERLMGDIIWDPINESLGYAALRLAKFGGW